MNSYCVKFSRSRACSSERYFNFEDVGINAR